MPMAPEIASETSADGVVYALTGAWTLSAGARLERQADALVGGARDASRATLDISDIEGLDTAGAWILDRTRQSLTDMGVEATLVGARPEHAILLREARYRPTEEPARRGMHSPVALLADVGESVYGAGVDLLDGLAFLGRLVVVAIRVAAHPRRWRFTSAAFHLEMFSLRSAPIILMINFFVGAIVAQQGVFQLSRFGASSLTVDLVGILTLRELGVLLTAIMVAGRTGSAITAEIGAMNMREELDAMRVMALDPLEVLILPRVIALIVALPILTFLADFAALFGGMCVTWFYGVTPQAFITELQSPQSLMRFEIGMFKAPFLALTIAIIAAAEGFAVKGSAESLGSRVTASVVKSIFMVIVLDGVFAVFFAAINS